MVATLQYFGYKYDHKDYNDGTFQISHIKWINKL